MTPLFQWAMRNKISAEALEDLERSVLGTYSFGSIEKNNKRSESAVLQSVRVKASVQGRRLFRNNCGVAQRPDGTPIRFGLANESPNMHNILRSSDLIGITPVIVGHHHVGKKFGLFTSWEIKKPDWTFNPNDKHIACQHAWNNLIISLGGDARFITSENQI